MFENAGQTALRLVSQYGFIAVVVFTFLEASLLFPFLPSEVVVPGAAALLIDGSVTFALFVASVVVGTTTGSLVVYYLFARFGRAALEDHGSWIRISEDDLDRGCDCFLRWGESSVLWGRLLPVLRSVISIPAGLAEMARWKFTLYTAIGAAGFGAGVAWLVVTGIQLLPSLVPH